MTVEIIEVEQGSEAWFRARMGIPTASEFAKLLGIKKDARDKETRRKYLYQLAGEIISGEPAESYSNAHMERGKAMEAEAREEYAFIADVEPQQVGFIRNGRKGCSPDSLIGDAGMLELKTKLPALLLEAMFRGEFPPEHRAQCQGAMWVAEREWIDLAIYWPRMRLVTYRATRDEAYITELARAVDEFNADLDALVDRYRRYGEPAREMVKRDLERSLLMAG